MTDFSQKTIKTLEDKFTFQPLNIEFDENLEPKERNEDYMLLREIFTNPEVMKTSTFFACGTPETELDLHLAMIASTEPETNFRKDYGLHKVWHTKLKKYIGVTGLIRRKEYAENKFIAEGLIFLKSKYIGSGLGFWVEKCFFQKLTNLNAILVASVWEENKTAIKLMKKNGMVQKGSFIKVYKNKAIKVLMFIKLPNNLIIPDSFLDIEEFFTCNKVSKLASVQNL